MDKPRSTDEGCPSNERWALDAHPCYPVSDVVPHQGTMSLLTRILGWGDDSLHALAVIMPTMPMTDQSGLPAWAGLELMAQATAALAGCHARKQGLPPQIGFLLGSRRYLCSCAYFPLRAELDIRITQSLRGDNGLCVFDCTITGRGEHSGITASASVNIFQPADPEQFIRQNTANADATQ